MPSTDIAIHADSLSKRYRLTEQNARYRTLRSSLSDALASPFRGRRRQSVRPRRDRDTSMWALKDVSFEIRRGDVVGVIGRNGAGKSTLLKLLSRITEPTEGHAEIRGRVGSLLEVGTGFHNELTGRENIFLNGAILGMRKTEIIAKFDEIVAFAEVERFVDTPVKHYSTGMYLRLAFAVAAHLEPEILLVDEVLAVGDVAFQAKCLGKMDRVARQGRTVIFVSHNMSAVRSLCHTGLVLDEGKVAVFGDVSGAIETYYRMVGALKTESDATPKRGFGPVTINGGHGTVNSGEGFRAATTFNVPDEATGFSLYCMLADMHGRQVFSLVEGVGSVTPGIYAADVTIPPLWLVTGLYSLHFKVLFSGSFASARHVSDHVPVDIVGRADRSNVLLAPDASWSVRRSGDAK
jgi:lipopolysaccharide transport system ATP-binding protein